MEEQEPNPLKEDPRDSALWKANKPGEDTAGDSPWGRGRRGDEILQDRKLGQRFAESDQFAGASLAERDAAGEAFEILYATQFFADFASDDSLLHEVGDSVQAGQTILIVEAMKHMNEVAAPRSGKVVEILVGDGQPVEYGEPLMIIE